MLECEVCPLLVKGGTELKQTTIQFYLIIIVSFLLKLTQIRKRFDTKSEQINFRKHFKIHNS